jgi:hypothetical protein
MWQNYKEDPSNPVREIETERRASEVSSSVAAGLTWVLMAEKDDLSICQDLKYTSAMPAGVIRQRNASLYRT